MSALQAIPTEHGIDILNSELKSTVTKYQLIGAVTHDADSDSLHPFHNDKIETSFYDGNGVLTFIVNLPIDTHFSEYLYKINVLDNDDKVVIECDTPKVALAKGIGGIVTLKAAISGQAGDVVFKHGEYVTEAEVDLHLEPIRKELRNMVGLIGEFHHSGAKPGWVDLQGGELSRATDKLLWDYAVTAEMVISQATKNADPIVNAMKFGDGDGATTFTLPNHHLGLFVRGNPSGINHGETQTDAMRNLEGQFSGVLGLNNSANGVFTGVSWQNNQPSAVGGGSYVGIKFDASLQVPVADEFRPKTANLSIKIHRGWM